MLITPLQTQVLTQLAALRGFDFQQAIVELMYLVHTPDGFQDLRQVRDGGCDGLVVSEKRSIACYGPEDRALSTFRKKLKHDYANYAKTWRETYPQWRVYINRQASPEEIKLVEGLQGGADLWGLQRIAQTIEQLPWDRRLKLYRFLRIEDALIGRDFLRPLLNDLVAMKVVVDTVSYQRRAPDIALKIKANFAEDEAAAIDRLVSLTFEQQAAAEAALTAYDETDLTRIKTRILTDFDQVPGVRFGDRLRGLLKQYVTKYNPGEDDGLNQYIQALLYLLFAQCLMGSPPSGEA